MNPENITIRNYRAIEEAVVPLTSKTCALIGPNNSGKSNVLRALSIFSNNKPDRAEGTALKFEVEISCATLVGAIPNLPHAKEAFLYDFRDRNIRIEFTTENGRYKATNIKNVGDGLRHYATSDLILNEMGSKSSFQANILTILNRIEIDRIFVGSSYLPNIRFVTQQGAKLPFHNNWEFPGENIAFENLIPLLAEIDRPSQEFENFKAEKSRICEFMAYTLDVARTDFEVSHDRSKILFSINDEQRPLDDFGTGVEQLLLIATASRSFSGRYVLIDEPEVHLHPKTQKRVVKYLSDDKSDKSNFIFATHSPAIIDFSDIGIVNVRREKNKSFYTPIYSNRERHEAVRALGHRPSELLQTNFVIWVEGPSDRIYLNAWIRWKAPELNEGIDYSILIYGGRLLSAHSFEDAADELIQCLTLSRRFCVLIDSDKQDKGERLNFTKLRVKKECETNGGHAWITMGREIENYIPDSVLSSMHDLGVVEQSSEFSKVFSVEKPDKMKIAKTATASEWVKMPLDLEAQIGKLIKAIKAS